MSKKVIFTPSAESETWFREPETTPAFQFKTVPGSRPESPAAAPTPAPSSEPDSPPYELPETPSNTERLEEICQSLWEKDPGLTVLQITEPLMGKLDFRFLEDRNIREIQLAEHGQVVKVEGLPKTLQKFTCTHNSLNTLLDLPESLLELNVSYNELFTVDFSRTRQLRVFRGDHNHLTSLDELPATLEEIYVNHNQLTELNLNGLTKLRILHGEHNRFNRRLLTLTHVPSHPFQMFMDEGPFQQVQPETGEDAVPGTGTSPTPGKTPKIDYLQALNQYMMYKSKYENSAKRWREKQRTKDTKGKPPKKATYPPCIHCAAHVGMTFTRREVAPPPPTGTDKSTTSTVEYYASCGATPSKKNCDFLIRLNAGVFMSFHELIRHEAQHLDEEKQQFMQQKMQTLFGYMQEKDSTELFKSRLETFMDTQMFYDSLVQDYLSMYHNDSRQDVIDKHTLKMGETRAEIASMMDEYRSDPTNHALLHDAIEAQIQVLEPEMAQLRRLKYPVVEMNHHVGSTGEIDRSTLFQQGYDLDRLSFMIKPPNVLEYRIDSA